MKRKLTAQQLLAMQLVNINAYLAEAYFDEIRLTNPTYYQKRVKQHLNLAGNNICKAVSLVQQDFDAQSADWTNDLVEDIAQIQQMMLMMKPEARKELIGRIEHEFKTLTETV